MPKQIVLTRGYVTSVCDCHSHLVINQKWRVTFSENKPYAIRTCMVDGSRKMIFLHKVINRTPDGLHTDHINGDTLDNKCINLRAATCSQNLCNRGKTIKNTSGFKGVHWDNQRNRWRARIVANGKVICLGRYNTALDAAKAYDAGAIKYHGKFSKTNF